MVRVDAGGTSSPDHRGLHLRKLFPFLDRNSFWEFVPEILVGWEFGSSFLRGSRPKQKRRNLIAALKALRHPNAVGFEVL